MRRRIGCHACIVAAVVGLWLLLVLGPWEPPARPDFAPPTATPVIVVVVITATAPAPMPSPSPTDVPEPILTTPTVTPPPTRTLGATATPSATVIPDQPVEEQINATPTSEGGVQRG